MAINPVEIIIRAKDEASSIFSSMGSKVAAVGASIAAYFGINAFVGAVKGAADLQAKLSEVQAVSGATTAEMVLLRKASEDAGTTTKYTATEAADALGNLARAGLSAKDTIAALPAVLQLAQAGGIDLAQASEFITKATMGMGMAFSDAGRVADVLAMGANASNTSVTGLAQALSYAAPLANTLGLDLETTVAIIGKFADAGIDASRAGTALNAIMAQFSDPASKFREELAGAGITTTNFEQALRQLAAAGPAGSKAINAVGTEAGPALRALLNQGIGALDDLKGKLDGAAGSAAKTAAVMEDNLNGSINSLSSAWDSLKNALATPVLPVLTDGIKQLAGAFSEAVSNGTIAKFGATIATAFEGGIKWVKAFAAEVDFTALYARMQAFAASTQETFTKIGDYASNAGNIVKTAYGVMAAGANAVLTAIYGLGVAIGGVVEVFQRALASLYDGMAKITFGSVAEKYRQMAADVRQSAEATNAANRAMADKAIESFNDMGDAAQLARNGWTGLTDDTQAASAQASAADPAFQSMAETLKGVGTAAADAGTKVSESADKQQAASGAAIEKVAALRAEYEAAVATGNWQLAAEKMQALRDAAKEATTSTADLKKKAEEDAAAIAASFERMGIKTKDQLATFAATAKQDFERIKESGQATAEGLQSAFKKYAEAAIAANGGVATEALKTEAAMRGLQITTDNTGKSIVQAMDSGAKSVDGVSKAVKEATGYMDVFQRAALDATKALEAQNAATEKGIAAQEKANDLKQRAIDLENKRRNMDSEGYALNTKGERIVESMPTERSVYEQAKGQGLSEAQALQIKNQFMQNGQMVNATGRTDANGGTWYTALQKAIDDLVLQNAKAAANTSAAEQSQSSSTKTYTNSKSGNEETFYTGKASPANPINHTYSVFINSGVRGDIINVASDKDAKNLIDVLQRAKFTAG